MNQHAEKGLLQPVAEVLPVTNSPWAGVEVSLAQVEAVIEAVIQQSYVELGQALDVIRDRRLYREQGFNTFEEYCAKRWGWTRQHAYFHIQAAAVVENVKSICQSQPSLTQAISLATLPADQQREIASSTDFTNTTVKEIKEKVKQIRQPGKKNLDGGDIDGGDGEYRPVSLRQIRRGLSKERYRAELLRLSRAYYHQVDSVTFVYRDSRLCGVKIVHIDDKKESSANGGQAV
jgi:hypothetical protein